ncbi:MAG: TM2 domain-containing protein [Candidatus Sumerlaeota bacterium]|nr:TM2 domain-containing protein [Candidatus Sumerlaeota bacterium]
MFCRNCGKEVHPNAVACPGCGVPPMLEKKFCSNCGAATDPSQVVCIKCGSGLAPIVAKGKKDKTAAGLLAIFLGYFGIHKFYLGYTTEGIVFLVITLLTCGWGGLIAWPVAFIEGIIYLTKSDEEFDQTYVQAKRGWF